jgi:hypothetical protein
VAGAADLADAAEVADDNTLLRYLATLELALALAYDAARMLGHLDATSSEIAARFANHHRFHAHSLEVDAGVSDTQPNAALLAELSPRLQAANSHDATLAALQGLEKAIAATHLSALASLRYAASAGTVADILPSECQHDVVLGTLLHQPLPALATATGEEPTAGALDPASYPAP